MHIHTRHTRSNSPRCTATRPQGIYHTWVAEQKDDITQDIQKYWLIRQELAMINGVAIKGKRIIISSQLKMQILSQLHNNQMEIEKMSLLVCEFVYWVNMNTDIQNTVQTCLEFQNTHLQEKKYPMEYWPSCRKWLAWIFYGQ